MEAVQNSLWGFLLWLGNWIKDTAIIAGFVVIVIVVWAIIKWAGSNPHGTNGKMS